jgi:hypothetical protein
LPAWSSSETNTVVLELPPLAPREPATRIIPSLSALSEHDYSFRFEARVSGDGGWTALSPVGPHGFAPSGEDDAPDDRLSADIDVLTARPGVDEVRLRITLHAPDLDAVIRAPILITASLSSERLAPHTEVTGLARLDVPAHSQMEAPEQIRRRICSPTCVAMVLAYWNRPVALATLAGDMLDTRHDLYGVWPAAIRAAARHGVAGYLLRFPSWETAAWCLERGLPVIASVRYAAGELRGAAIEATAGHLLVLTGYDGETVFANDPAAPTADAVPRRYALTDLRRVWLERSGVGYVLFAPTPTIPAGAVSPPDVDSVQPSRREEHA